MDRAEELLIACLRASVQPQRAAELENRAAGVDFDAFVDRAIAERLAPVAYEVLRERALLPAEALQQLRAVYRQTAMRNMILLHEAEQLFTRLAALSIPVIALKGVVLSATLYRDPALRPMQDIDLLLRPADLEAATQALAGIGFRPVRAAVRDSEADFEVERILVKQAAMPVPAELHWSLFDSTHHQHRIAMDWFWDTSVPTQVGRAPVRELGSEALLLHLCGHLSLHHSHDNRMWLHDVALLIAARGAHLDWDLVLERARLCDLVLPLHDALVRLDAEWGAPIPAAVLGAARGSSPSAVERRVYDQLTTPGRSVARRFADDLRGLPTWRARLAFASASLFPSPRYMRERYGCRNAALLPFYYLYRWGRGIHSALTG